MILLDDQTQAPTDDQQPVTTGEEGTVETGEDTGMQPEVPGEATVTDMPETGEESGADEPAGDPSAENPDSGEAQDQAEGQPA